MNITAGPFVFDGDFYVQNHGDWYRSIDKGASWVLYTMPDIVAERDRLAAENEALCAFVDVVDDYEAEFDGVQPIRDARAAIEPILTARRAATP